MSEKIFEFDAGDISLDFANTNDWHASEHPVEKLTSYLDLVAWGEQAGLVSPGLSRHLRNLATEQPEQATRAYRFAIQIREVIFRIFSARYKGQPIPAADLAALNAMVRQAMAHRQLVPSGAEFHWEWTPDVAGTDLLIWPVATSAAQLLTSEKASRVRVCEDDRGCGYLFIDQSKNHSRRWCSMESCGNRAKARRHYSRLQAG